MEEPRKVPIKVQVKDKRRVGRDKAGEAAPSETAVAETEAEVLEAEVLEAEVLDMPPPAETAEEESPESQPDYLEALQRSQADFANYRKRATKQIAEATERVEARMVERMLPVLDNFERAIAHGEGGEGVEMVFKELRSVLEDAGLTEVPGEGAPFDYHVHQAVESHEDESVSEEVVRTVHRRGYTMNDKLLRAAMVGVARPVASASGQPTRPIPLAPEETSDETSEESSEETPEE